MSQSSNQLTDFTNPIYSTVGEKLYLSKKSADFYLIFEISDGKYERIPAHKNLLVAASDVFEVMFNGTWKEKNEVEIVDAPIAVQKNAHLSETWDFLYIILRVENIY